MPHPDALTPHYGIGPGKIAIHFDVDHTTRDGSGNVTALQNRGGGGAVFDATVSGAAIPVNGAALDFGAASGVPVMASPADLQGVRLMWAMGRDRLATIMRIFGHAGSPPYSIRLTGAATRLYADQANYGAGSMLHSVNYPFPGAGMILCELEISGASSTVWVDGVAYGTSTIDTAQFVPFLLSRIGRGGSDSTPFLGLMGDVLGVTLGAGDAAAIAAARAYLAARHGVVLA